MKKIETTYTRRIVGIVKESIDLPENEGITVIISYTFSENVVMDIHELSAYGAYPNILRMTYLRNPVAFSKQLERAIRNIEGENVIFSNKTVTIL